LKIEKPLFRCRLKKTVTLFSGPYFAIRPAWRRRLRVRRVVLTVLVLLHATIRARSAETRASDADERYFSYHCRQIFQENVFRRLPIVLFPQRQCRSVVFNLGTPREVVNHLWRGRE